MTKPVRVIPCLDIKDGRVVKGVHFTGLRDAGDPVELARRYAEEGADEITFLDIAASSENRSTTVKVVEDSVSALSVPLTVGGGVRSVEDVERLLSAGAKKVGISTAAVTRPEVLTEISQSFSPEVIVLSVDARRGEKGATPSGFEITTHGGKRSTGLDALEWVKRATDLGAGNVLLNSMDADGTTSGFDLEMVAAVRNITTVPLIASGGAGSAEHFVAAARGGADAVLAASVFHFGAVSIGDVKAALADAGFIVS